MYNDKDTGEKKRKRERSVQTTQCAWDSVIFFSDDEGLCVQTYRHKILQQIETIKMSQSTSVPRQSVTNTNYKLHDDHHQPSP